MKDFKIQLYRGDTKKITVSLNVDGEDITLTGYTVKLVNRKPITSTQEELNANPRARSAKLRVCEKI